MNTKVLERAAARTVLGLFESDDMAQVAVQALELGCDSPALRVLAGLNPSEAHEAGPLFQRVLLECNVAVPSKRSAVMHLAREIAGEILAGRTSAHVGAKQIWDLARRASDEDFPQLDPFVYTASEWEDRPEVRSALEEDITAAARDLVNS